MTDLLPEQIEAVALAVANRRLVNAGSEPITVERYRVTVERYRELFLGKEGLEADVIAAIEAYEATRTPPDDVVEAAAKAYAEATDYYVPFHSGLSSESADKIRKGVAAALQASDNRLVDAWQPIETAPRDGTWFLMRGRNSVGHPMIPVVAAWRDGAFRDSASLKDMSSLICDVPPDSDGADWMPLPEPTAALKDIGR